MTTKSTGITERRVKTVVTDNKCQPAKHKLEEGCAREPMYSHRYVEDGSRHSHLADDPFGKEMKEWSEKWK